MIERVEHDEEGALRYLVRPPKDRRQQENDRDQVAHELWNVAEARTGGPEQQSHPDAVQAKQQEGGHGKKPNGAGPDAEDDGDRTENPDVVSKDDQMTPQHAINKDAQRHGDLADDAIRRD